MKNEIRIGDTFIHYKNNEFYEVIDTGLVIQEDQVWVPAVMYKGLAPQPKGHSNKIVRSEKEFLEKFTKVIKGKT